MINFNLDLDFVLEYCVLKHCDKFTVRPSRKILLNHRTFVQQLFSPEEIIQQAIFFRQYLLIKNLEKV